MTEMTERARMRNDIASINNLMANVTLYIKEHYPEKKYGEFLEARIVMQDIEKKEGERDD